MSTRKDRNRSSSSSPVPAATGQSPAVDETALVKIPIVRELILENEQLLCQMAAYRQLKKTAAAREHAGLLADEALARAALTLAEADARQGVIVAAHASLAEYLLAAEDALSEAQESNDRLQGYMALAQANLTVHEDDHDEDDDGDNVNRRLSTSSADKENVSPLGGTRKRGAGVSPLTRKKVRLSLDNDGRPSSSGRRTQPSPSEITKDRKTLHETDLAVSPSKRKVVRLRRYK